MITLGSAHPKKKRILNFLCLSSTFGNECVLCFCIFSFEKPKNLKKEDAFFTFSNFWVQCTTCIVLKGDLEKNLKLEDSYVKLTQR